jgi:hypothetical protein
MSPFDSEDLSEIVAAQEGAFVVLQSPETAEHDPDYRKIARFPTRAEAEAFLSEGSWEGS